jgi:hypothetical protein
MSTTLSSVVPVPVTMNDLHKLDRMFYADAAVPVSANTWVRIGLCDFRLWPQRGCLRLWKRSFAPWLYAGHQDHAVVADSRLAREWIEGEQSRA